METSCSHCHSRFEVTTEDLVFLERISPSFQGQKFLIPAPTCCPDCRLQRRLAYRNEYHYSNRNCTCCNKPIVTIYPVDSSIPVYCYKCWWGDSWDPSTYSREINFTRSFFEQFHQFQLTVPQLALVNDNGVASENCEYCNDFAYGKNCYLTTASWHCEGNLYSTQCNYTKDVVDSFLVCNQCELVYESSACQNLYNCSFLSSSSNCSNCHFGHDLKGCKDCFCCLGLRQKQYCYFNQQLSAEAYQQKMGQINLGSHQCLEQLKAEYKKFKNTLPHRPYLQLNCENCCGNNLFNCRNLSGFGVFRGENSKFVWTGEAMKDCYDVISTGLAQWCYEGNTPDESYNCAFTIYCWKSKNLFYCDNCHSCEDSIACIALKRKKNCILNRAYSAHEYDQLAARLVAHMKETGEWGEFFPMHFSPFPYNFSRAQDVFELNRSQAAAFNLPWKDHESRAISGIGELPDDIKDANDSISSQACSCQDCHKSFKILKLELAFHRKMQLALPRKCPSCRRKDRYSRAPSGGQTFSRQCPACQTALISAYSSERPELVYCESCYEKNLYS